MHNKQTKNQRATKLSSPILTDMLVKFYRTRLVNASRCKVTNLKNK